MCTQYINASSIGDTSRDEGGGGVRECKGELPHTSRLALRLVTSSSHPATPKSVMRTWPAESTRILLALMSLQYHTHTHTHTHTTQHTGHG
jgi:hypothetical protein